jgi:hypothetical protein
VAEDTSTRKGIAIISPYGGIWSNELFETAEAARRYLADYWKKTPHHDLSGYRLARATQTVTLIRAPGELLLIDMPKGD